MVLAGNNSLNIPIMAVSVVLGGNLTVGGDGGVGGSGVGGSTGSGPGVGIGPGLGPGESVGPLVVGPGSDGDVGPETGGTQRR